MSDMRTKLERAVQMNGYMALSFRLLQLIGKCVLGGSGNMSAKDKRELKSLLELR